MSDTTILVIAIVAAIGVIWVILYKVSQHYRRLRLMEKYGDEEDVDRIMREKVWQGATLEQVVDSWGMPDDVDKTVLKNKTKQTWKYGETGKNRYRNRVFIENDRVVGWQSQ